MKNKACVLGAGNSAHPARTEAPSLGYIITHINVYTSVELNSMSEGSHPCAGVVCGGTPPPPLRCGWCRRPPTFNHAGRTVSAASSWLHRSEKDEHRPVCGAVCCVAKQVNTTIDHDTVSVTVRILAPTTPHHRR